MNIIFIVVAGVYINVSSIVALEPSNTNTRCSIITVANSSTYSGYAYKVKVKKPCSQVLKEIKNAALEGGNYNER